MKKKLGKALEVLGTKGKRYKFTRENARHVFHVFLWTVASAIVASMISFLASVDVAPEYMFIIPIVNTLLVAAKEFTNSQR